MHLNLLFYVNQIIVSKHLTSKYIDTILSYVQSVVNCVCNKVTEDVNDLQPEIHVNKLSDCLCWIYYRYMSTMFIVTFIYTECMFSLFLYLFSLSVQDGDIGF